MNFDRPIRRLGTHSVKWDMMEGLYGVPSEEGIPMWVADMDFQTAPPVQQVLRQVVEHGIYGYYGDEDAYYDAICWWMKNRHGWEVNPAHIFTTHGLVNAVALLIDTFSTPGEGIVLMTPVYHAFSRVIKAAERRLVECPLALKDGRYVVDTEAWDRQLNGEERILILSSPHNPGGRVWNIDELKEIAAFCQHHDLLLLSDEIHHDLVMPGQRHHIMALMVPEIADRLIMLTSASKTFNIAGMHTGNVIIADDKLRRVFSQRMRALSISPNGFAQHMVTAAYSADGAAWVDLLIDYIDQNRRLFDQAMNDIPGVRSMALEATYLAWVDFSALGMNESEVRRRILEEAAICPSYGESFGRGGEGFMRFNLATRRDLVEQAIMRLQRAFADVQ